MKHVVIEPRELVKPLVWIMQRPEEIGWLGIAEENTENKIQLKGLRLFPQIVTADGVFYDQEEYDEWLYDNQQDGKLNYFGHSHGRRPCTPSRLDITRWNEITEDGKLHVFQIWNAKCEVYTQIYDNKMCVETGVYTPLKEDYSCIRRDYILTTDVSDIDKAE